MKNRIYRWGPPILLMAIIFAFSNTPGSEMPGFGSWDFIVKKGGHMCGYALLAAAFCRALNNGKSTVKLRTLLALCMTAAYAASDEFHQKFVPGRNASFSDIGIDILGGLIGIMVLRFLQGRLSPPVETSDPSS